MKGLIIGGTQSGCGKTTVVVSIISALKKRGLTVQPFKAGPDYIDAGLHGLCAGRPSINLDQWMINRDMLLWSFQTASSGADISIVEGVMGLFDGGALTAGLSCILKLPVVLIVDVSSMGESAAAVVYGFKGFFERFYGEESPGLRGVILNKVGSERHLRMLKETVQGVEVLGHIPRDEFIEIQHRHLGLITAEEEPLSAEHMDRLSQLAERYIDLDRLFEVSEIGLAQEPMCFPFDRDMLKGLRVACARDRAFCFYYHDNLRLLELAGAEISFFSPLEDPLPPEADFYYLGGGYPELYADRLSKNTSMLSAFKKLAERGSPIYAECGGFMFLTKGIHHSDGKFYPMAGVFPLETEMTTKRVALGYREVVLEEDCPLGTKGNTLRGHEFHYSKPRFTVESIKNIYTVRDRWGKTVQVEGLLYKNCLGSYVHLHFLSNPGSVLNSLRSFVS